jgi:hypothetical protein
VIAFLGLAAGAAEAKTFAVIHQVRAVVPFRIDKQIAFVPIGGMSGVARIRAGGNVYVGLWSNATSTRESLTPALKAMRRDIKYGGQVNHGAYADRRLTSAERRTFEVLADIGRDADVLVVKEGHPACAGLSFAQVRAIAAGRTTSWSQVGMTPPGASDRIALRHTVIDGAFEPRFGQSKKPAAAKGRADGGIADATKDASVAGVTSWSRARFRSGICAVPIGGVEPTNVSVHNLAYPAAYPITFVTPKKRSRDPYQRKLLSLYVAFLKSEKAAKLFRGNGMLMAADTPSAPGDGPAGGSGPSRDVQGRSITSTRDDAAATSALTGERIVIAGGSERWAFEPGSVLNYLVMGETGCSQSSGSWTVVEGYRYAEYGGGIIARVSAQLDGAFEMMIELPGDAPGTAYLNGTEYPRSRDLAGSC